MHGIRRADRILLGLAALGDLASGVLGVCYYRWILAPGRPPLVGSDMGTALAVMLIAYGWAGLILIVAVAAIDSIRRENVVQFAIAIGLAGFLPMIVFVWYELTRSMGTTTASLRLRGR